MATISEQQRKQVIQASLDARNLSYSPYSKFRVGAAILCRNGDDPSKTSIVLGANVENASYGATICAERTAIVKAITEGFKPGSFLAISISGDIDNHCSPCGICRQVIREFSALSLPVYLPYSSWTEANDKEGTSYVCTSLEGLLPLSFGPEDLERDRI